MFLVSQRTDCTLGDKIDLGRCKLLQGHCIISVERCQRPQQRPLTFLYNIIADFSQKNHRCSEPPIVDVLSQSRQV